MTTLHADPRVIALVHGESLPWLSSPSAGVERKLLERIGGEVALATSIVRYAPGSRFDPHVHGAGEEFLVLDGVFSDEQGDYPALTYVRNPPGSMHAPRSAAGCTIFVKLRQMSSHRGERTVVAADTGNAGHQLLHRGVAVTVSLHRVAPRGTLLLDADHGGEEVFVVEGSAHAPGAELSRWSWWRRPASAGRCVLHTDHGVLLWVKRGHLDRIEG
jgi:anti-sigma factor ChrR (cupin superfamily)